MKAARISGPKQFEILEVEEPQLRDGQCLIKLERWSVCGSDIRHSYGPVLPEECYPLGIGSTCHECAGIVVESRSDRFEEGQRVIALPSVDGTGGMVEYIATEANRIVALPDEGDLSEWVTCQPAGTVIHGCQKVGTIIGKRVLVIGQGSIGLSFTAICARIGAKQVIAADPLDYRLEYSSRFGATDTVNPDRVDLYEAVKEITGGLMPDITVEASGYPDGLNSAFRMVADSGIVLMFGMQSEHQPHNEFTPVKTSYIHQNTPVILPIAASRGVDPISHIETMVALKSRGWWNPGEMVTHRLKFDDVKMAHDMYGNQADNIIKVVMSP